MTDVNQIHEFTTKWIEKFKDRDINYLELVETYMAVDCQSLGFVMDCGEEFTRNYREAFESTTKLREVINEITDVMLLGSAIYSKWRYFNHWAYSGSEILLPENREWFILALERLDELAKRI